MAQQIKVFATKSDDLNSVHGINAVEEENQLLKVVL